MALVIFLRGVNVGGHRTFRPKALAGELADLDVVNIGAAGTFVVRKPVPQALLRKELGRKLSFDTEIMICPGRDILRMTSRDPFDGQSVGSDRVPFVSVLARVPRMKPATPKLFPKDGGWMMKVLERDRRYVFGVYRRQMKAVGYLGEIDRVFGVPATTRNWNTINAIADVLGEGGA